MSVNRSWILVFLCFQGFLVGGGVWAEGWLDAVKGLLDPKNARAAFDHLISMGKGATPSLKQMLRGNNLRLVRAAMDLADKLGPSAEGVAADLVQLLQNQHLGKLRIRAVRTLGKFGESSFRYVPQLLATFKDSKGAFRGAVAECLVELYSKRLKNLPDLAKALGDPKHPFRRLLVEVLQDYGQMAHPAVPLLVIYMKRGRVEFHDVASLLVPKALPGLTGWVKMLSSTDGDVLGGLFTESGLPVSSQDMSLGQSVAEVVGSTSARVLPEDEAPLMNALAESWDDEGKGEGRPDSPAFEPSENQVNKADEAGSFEDIPAME